VHRANVQKQIDAERESSAGIVDKILQDTWADDAGPVEYEWPAPPSLGAPGGNDATIYGAWEPTIN